MKNIFILILTVVIIFSLSSCAIHSGLTGNLNNSTTNVVLQTNNYKIIQKVKGEASGMSVLGIFGGSFKPLVEKARSQMLESANLIGKSRAIINETVEVNNKFFVILGFKTVTVSAYVIEFMETSIVEGDGVEKTTPTTTDTSLKSSEPVIEAAAIIEDISGKWVAKKGEFEITIDGNVGIFSQINSGKWLNLLEKGKVSIGEPKFKDIVKAQRRSWKSYELIKDIVSIKWQPCSLILNEEGTMLTVVDPWGVTYTLSKVRE